NPVWCEPTPCLSCKKLPLSASDIHKILPQARRTGVAADIEICRIIAMKIRLNITEDIVSLERVSHLQAEARVFGSNACLGDLPWNCIRKGNREEIGPITAANICATPKNRQIKEPTGGEFRATYAERQR